MSRVRRSESGGGGGGGGCGLQQVTVNLTDIGWDMVISPATFQYKYCSGHCNVRELPPTMFVKSHGQIRYVS